jgi:hypothetical protein
MRWSSRLILLLLGALPLAAHAAQRAFVASSGLDTNPCSLVAPCRGFGMAVGAVADGGEVIVLDSAGYGAVTITKSVSIVAPPGVHAGVSVFFGGGVTVDGAGIKVVLRGLSIINQGGGNGIEFLQGMSLHVENCVISGFTGGSGIFVGNMGGDIHVLDSIVRDAVDGIVLVSLGGTANISRTRVERVTNGGISVLANMVVSIDDSVVTGSGFNINVNPLMPGYTYVTVARTLVADGHHGIIARPNAASTAHVTVMDSTIAHATIVGIYAIQDVGAAGTTVVTAVRNQLLGNTTALWAEGPTVRLVLDGNSATSNGTGVYRFNGATIVTRGNNTVDSNALDTFGTPYTSLSGI